jgi:hypothetical protein
MSFPHSKIQLDMPFFLRENRWPELSVLSCSGLEHTMSVQSCYPAKDGVEHGMIDQSCYAAKDV